MDSLTLWTANKSTLNIQRCGIFKHYKLFSILPCLLLKNCMWTRAATNHNQTPQSINEHQWFIINCCAWHMWQQQRNILLADIACEPKENKKKICKCVLPSCFNREKSASDYLSCHIWRGNSTLVWVPCNLKANTSQIALTSGQTWA